MIMQYAAFRKGKYKIMSFSMHWRKRLRNYFIFLFFFWWWDYFKIVMLAVIFLGDSITGNGSFLLFLH
jgi:hypothetical protein